MLIFDANLVEPRFSFQDRVIGQVLMNIERISLTNTEILQFNRALLLIPNELRLLCPQHSSPHMLSLILLHVDMAQLHLIKH